MTTNKEWLFSLPLEKQYEWMNAEHVDENWALAFPSTLEPKHANDDSSAENDVRVDDVDANDADMDTREKLEANVRAWRGKPAGVHDAIIGWLDRQAAITEREWRGQLSVQEYAKKSWYDKANELHEENEELQEQLEAAHAKNRALKAHISKMQEGRHGWHIKGKELQAKVDALTQANDDYRDEWHRVCQERDELRRELVDSNREREVLRKHLGIALDHAHDIVQLGSLDEGI